MWDAGAPVRAPRAWIGVPAVSLLWGLNWPAVRIVLGEIPPWTLRAWGLTTAAVLLFAFAAASGRSLAIRRGQWRRLAIAGCLNIAGFNIFVTFAQLAGTTSRAAIVTYTMPVWAIVFAWILLDEVPDRRRAAALALGAFGLLLLALPLFAAGRLTAGIGYALGAAASWAAGLVMLKRWPVDGHPLAVTAWQVLVGAFASVTGMLVFEGPGPAAMPSPAVIAAFFYHTVFAMALAYVLWFAITEHLPAGVSALAVLGVPAIGVLCATLFLGERPTWSDLGGLAAVVGAAALSLIPPRRRSGPGAPPGHSGAPS